MILSERASLVLGTWKNGYRTTMLAEAASSSKEDEDSQEGRVYLTE